VTISSSPSRRQVSDLQAGELGFVLAQWWRRADSGVPHSRIVRLPQLLPADRRAADCDIGSASNGRPTVGPCSIGGRADGQHTMGGPWCASGGWDDQPGASPNGRGTVGPTGTRALLLRVRPQSLPWVEPHTVQRCKALDAIAPMRRSRSVEARTHEPWNVPTTAARQIIRSRDLKPPEVNTRSSPSPVRKARRIPQIARAIAATPTLFGGAIVFHPRSGAARPATDSAISNPSRSRPQYPVTNDAARLTTLLNPRKPSFRVAGDRA